MKSGSPHASSCSSTRRSTPGASSLRELRDHWAVADAYDPEEKEETLARRAEEMYARAHEVLERSPGAELVYVEPATMSRLTPA